MYYLSGMKVNWMSYLPRWVNKVWALGGGYFWLPCPRCRNYFGGHEITYVFIETSPNQGVCTCHKCSKEIWKRTGTLSDKPRSTDVL